MSFMKNLDLELVENNVCWEDIPSVLCQPSALDEFDNLCKTLDNLPEEEQLEFLADMIYNSLFN